METIEYYKKRPCLFVTESMKPRFRYYIKDVDIVLIDCRYGTNYSFQGGVARGVP